MRNVVVSAIAIVLLPVSIVLVMGAATGVLSGGITSATSGDVVNGYNLDGLRQLPEASLVPAGDVITSRHDVEGSSLVFGEDRPPVAGVRVLTQNTYDRTLRSYDEALESLGFEKIETPTPLIPQADERFATVWQRDNLYARLVTRTNTREFVESGGELGQLLYQFTVVPIGDPPDEGD